MSSQLPYAPIMKEDGVVDLPTLTIRGMFAKALFIEREEGHTTPEALDALSIAIDAETKFHATVSV